MAEEAEFAALYKKLIGAHFAPEPARREAALRGILSRLAAPAEVPLEKAGPLCYNHPREEREGCRA